MNWLTNMKRKSKKYKINYKDAKNYFPSAVENVSKVMDCEFSQKSVLSSTFCLLNKVFNFAKLSLIKLDYKRPGTFQFHKGGYKRVYLD